MNDERSEQASNANQVEGAAQCGPGCDCGKTGLGTKGKVIICLVVAIAAAVVLAHGFTRKAENETGQEQKAFAATALAPSPVAPPATTENPTVKETHPVMFSFWGEPLKNMASLNEIAAQKDAVFVYLPEKGREPDETVKRQIEQAADKVPSGGMTIAFFTLDDGSKDYAEVTGQVPAPCVLAMVKGRGMNVVTGDISEGKLIQAIVAASRPSSGCCPSGSGSSSSGCQ